MNSQELLTLLVSNERLLEKLRTTSLARANWAKVLETDAKLEYSRWVRKQLVDHATNQAAKSGPVALGAIVGGGTIS